MTRELDDVRLVIVDPDGGFFTIAKKCKIKNLKINDRVLFTDPLYALDKLKAYVDADVHVLPSVFYIFGITVLEAINCGTSVIVTDKCGIADLIGKVGYVVEHNKDQLRDAIFNFLSDK